MVTMIFCMSKCCFFSFRQDLYLWKMVITPLSGEIVPEVAGLGDGGELGLDTVWWMVQKSGVVNSPVEGTVGLSGTIIWSGFSYIQTVVGRLGFLNHQQQETDSRFNCGGEGSGLCLSIPKEKPVTQKTHDDWPRKTHQIQQTRYKMASQHTPQQTPPLQIRRDCWPLVYLKKNRITSPRKLICPQKGTLQESRFPTIDFQGDTRVSMEVIVTSWLVSWFISPI